MSAWPAAGALVAPPGTVAVGPAGVGLRAVVGVTVGGDAVVPVRESSPHAATTEATNVATIATRSPTVPALPIASPCTSYADARIPHRSYQCAHRSFSRSRPPRTEPLRHPLRTRFLVGRVHAQSCSRPRRARWAFATAVRADELDELD